MSMFDAFPKDDFYFIDAKGKKSKVYQGIMSKGKVTFPGEDLPASDGETAIRILPNTKEEHYKISDLRFQKGLHGIPNHYVVSLIKASSLPNIKDTIQNVTITNSPGVIIGSNNSQDIDFTVIAKGFQDLIKSIKEGTASDSEKKEALGTLKAVFNNPTIASILGGISGGLVSLIK